MKGEMMKVLRDEMSFMRMKLMCIVFNTWSIGNWKIKLPLRLA